MFISLVTRRLCGLLDEDSPTSSTFLEKLYVQGVPIRLTTKLTSTTIIPLCTGKKTNGGCSSPNGKTRNAILLVRKKRRKKREGLLREKWPFSRGLRLLKSGRACTHIHDVH